MVLALKNVVRPILKDCKSVVVSSSGKFFIMKEIHDFFKTLTSEEFPNLTIEILTNGQLLTREKWRVAEISFIQLTNLGTFTNEEFKKLIFQTNKIHII